MENILTIYLPEIITIITILFIGYTTKQQICYILSILFILFILYFNRDFKGSFDKSDKTIIIPADGKITQIIRGKYYTMVHIYLDITNIHKQYVPYDGKIIHVSQKKGFYKQAYSPEARRMNSKITTIFDTKIGKIAVEQISGFLVRKIIAYGEPGDIVKKGDKLGFIKFGSLVTITFPNSVKIIKNIGDRVTIGSVLGVIRAPI
jgi:phosphatidylserine decarboxylase